MSSGLERREPYPVGGRAAIGRSAKIGRATARSKGTANRKGTAGAADAVSVPRLSIWGKPCL